MRNLIDIVKSALSESTEETFTLYHGSDYADIESFRTRDIRNRTGTPGTLSFTTSIETAKIYGKYLYRVEVAGDFGDYRNPDDVEKVFEYRKQEALRDGYFQRVMGDDPSKWASLFERIRRDITEGHYAKWENKHLWNAMGWQGAWCFESGSVNLIVGDEACVKRILGKTTREPDWKYERKFP